MYYAYMLKCWVFLHCVLQISMNASERFPNVIYMPLAQTQMVATCVHVIQASMDLD